MFLGSRKIRLKSKWNTSCRVVPPYPKGRELLLECSKRKFHSLVHFFKETDTVPGFGGDFSVKANPEWKYRTHISRVRGPHFLCARTMNEGRKRICK